MMSAKKLCLWVAIALVLTGVATSEDARKITHWVAPMDPTYISDSPGKSPMGMDLIPVYEDRYDGSMVSIDPVVVQNMGVRIERIGRDTLFRHVRTIGTVDIAENQLSVVNLRFSGWVEKIFVDETGVHVTKGQKLFDIYSPELVSAQEEYLLALRGADKDSPLVKSARRRLELWDLSPSQIMRVEHQDKAMRTMTIVAPQAGYILHKNIVNGARVKSGADLYRIGNLTKIWVNADVYEFDVPWIQLGQRATMELTFQQGKKYVGEVSYIYPTMNTKTRTLTVRLEFENPGLSLKPGMFATVQIEAQGKQDVLVVPSESIIHSGTRQLVFVAIDLGRYDVREVTTGVVGDQYVTEVLSGLHEGERVVTSGQFMLDSESQLHEAVQKLLAARLHAREERVQAPGSDTTEEHDHGSDDLGYWTCGMHPQVVSDDPGSCPICGMNLTKAQRDKQ
jgi:multidrug efflux pump subunit AcrA (membrane-fusion protein)